MSKKYEQLAGILRSELQQLARQGITRLPTEAELSQRYHMSRQTVRHALQLLEADGLILRRQGSGSYLQGTGSSTDTHQVAVVTTFLDDYIFPSILHDVQTVLAQEGYSTLVFATENQVIRERDILTRLLDMRISAILIEGTKTALPTGNDDLYQLLRAKGVPVLFLHGTYSNLSGFPCLQDDNFSGGYQLTRYLLNRGHTSIAGIFKSDDIQGPQRYHGMISALRDSGISIPDSRILWYDTMDRAELVAAGSGTLLTSFVHNRLEDATAVVCYNDEIAYLLIRQLLATGKAVPKDVAVASFDNSFYSQIGPIPITSLGHKSNRPGRMAAAMLLQILSGAQPKFLPLEWELFCRTSA
ncbi:MAG: GntR family transcriptional regulator [Faecousia sp.]